MLFETRSTQAAAAGLDALWLKTQVIANNLANVDTPGFKASSVSFEEALGKAAGRIQNKEGQEIDGAKARRGGAVYRTTVSTESDTSVRVDGNNVSLEYEQTELWKAYAQYSYLLDKVSGHYGAINTAISNMSG